MFFEEDTSPQPFVESPVYFEPLVSVEDNQFFDVYIATAAMSEPKSELVLVLSHALEYKVWRAKATSSSLRQMTPSMSGTSKTPRTKKPMPMPLAQY